MDTPTAERSWRLQMGPFVLGSLPVDEDALAAAEVGSVLMIAGRPCLITAMNEDRSEVSVEQITEIKAIGPVLIGPLGHQQPEV